MLKTLLFSLLISLFSTSAMASGALVPDNFQWETGQVIVTRHNWHPYSLFIQLGTLSNAEHVGLVIVENSRPIVYEYWSNKFRKTPVSVFLERIKLRKSDSLVAIGQIPEIKKMAKTQLQPAISYMNLAVNTQNFSEFNPSCSQFLVDALKKVGIFIESDKTIPSIPEEPLLYQLTNHLNLDIEALRSVVSPRSFVQSPQVIMILQWHPIVVTKFKLLMQWQKNMNWRLLSRFASPSLLQSVKQFIHNGLSHSEERCHKLVHSDAS